MNNFNQFPFDTDMVTKTCILCVVLMLLIFSGCKAPDEKQSNNITIGTPEELYGQLFYDVQSSNVYEFRDSKTFCDVIPVYPLNEIRSRYSMLINKSDTAALKQFIHTYFELPTYADAFTDSSEIHQHIHLLWEYLFRTPDVYKSGTLIPLPRKYVVPGGRFREIYYWDTYFTMLGLIADGRIEMIREMIGNFSFLLDSLGFIPNGNRTYYLTRSQPPFFSLMINLLASVEKSDNVYLQFTTQLRKEYSFWMDGIENTTDKNRSYRRVVRLSDGSIMNRYWDDLDTPRPEAYKEDTATAHKAYLKSGRKKSEVYRNIRAAAESGWDFSSRWFKDTFSMSSIHTIDIIPVDLNCLIYNLELTLAKSYQIRNNADSAAYFKKKALQKKKAINSYCWSSEKKFFMDYDFVAKRHTPVYSLAGVYPLFMNIATTQQALHTALKIKNIFLKDGGVVATTFKTGQQWDAPNGWAPLHWITINGLKNYNFETLATAISGKWVTLNKKIYYQTWKLMEKYDVEDTTRLGGGGEYPSQDGFGWTNGVFLKLSKQIKF